MWIKAEFGERLNRFLGKVLLGGRDELVHITDPGRLKELLVPGAEVFVRPAQSPGRKTSYTLVAVKHRGVLVSLDSDLPNRLVHHLLTEGLWPRFRGAQKVRREVRVGGSRLDIELTHQGQRWLLEVKACTLVRDGLALFPDAPTERGRRHLELLMELQKRGMAKGGVVFVVQRPDAQALSPNWDTDPAFGETLRRAVGQGVGAWALLTEPIPEGMPRFLGEIPVKI